MDLKPRDIKKNYRSKRRDKNKSFLVSSGFSCMLSRLQQHICIISCRATADPHTSVQTLQFLIQIIFHHFKLVFRVWQWIITTNWLNSVNHARQMFPTHSSPLDTKLLWNVFVSRSVSSMLSHSNFSRMQIFIFPFV